VCVVRRTAGSNPALSASSKGSQNGAQVVTANKEGTLEIIAALLVLFTAMLDPKISLVLAIVVLAAFGLSHLMKKS
jgi:hypothetical protein